MTQWFTIARILPRRLGLNGSSASAEILAQTLRAMGHEVSVVDVWGPDDVPSAVDIVTLGSCSTSAVAPALTELISLVRIFHRWKETGVMWVAEGMSWHLLGEALITAGGDTVPGAGVFPSTADHRPSRFSGEVQGTDHRGRRCAGYINQFGSAELLEGVKPLLTFDDPPEGLSPHDGLVGENLFATTMGGPALALNPHWAMDIVTSVLGSRSLSPEPGDFHTRVEVAAERARELIHLRLTPRRR